MALLPILTIVVALSTWLAITRLRVGAVFGASSLSLLVLASIFGVRPLFMISDSNYEFYGTSVRNGFEDAALLGFVGVLAFAVGNIGFYLRRRDSADGAVEIADGVMARVTKVALVSIVWTSMWFVLVALKGGGFGFIAQVFQGRNPDTNAVLAGLPVFVGALPVAGAVSVAVARIATATVRQLSRREVVLFWLSSTFALVPPLALGVRRYLIPSLIATILAVVFPIFFRRIGPRMIIVSGAAFLGLATIPFVRSKGSRGSSDSIVAAAIEYYSTSGGMANTFRDFFVSYDTEMFNYVAATSMRLGRTIEFGLGRGTLGDFFLNPLPAGMLPSELWSDRVLAEMFGGGCAVAVCPVPSLIGVLNSDFGLAGVVVGSFVAGRIVARVATIVEDGARGRLGKSFVLAFTLSVFMPVLIRGNTTNVLYIALLSFVMSSTILRLCLPSRISSVARRASVGST